jgi:hypothetical protein
MTARARRLLRAVELAVRAVRPGEHLRIADNALEPGVSIVAIEKDGRVAVGESRRQTATVAVGEAASALTM